MNESVTDATFSLAQPPIEAADLLGCILGQVVQRQLCLPKPSRSPAQTEGLVPA